MTRFLNRAAAAVIACGLLVPGALSAQHGLVSGGSYDPSVPTPRSVLGYEIGERFTPHHLMLRYVEAVANASPRIKLDTVAYTFEGREVMMVTATSEANHTRASPRSGPGSSASPTRAAPRRRSCRTPSGARRPWSGSGTRFTATKRPARKRRSR